MNPERWQKVKEVFLAVTEAPAFEREAVLAAACAGDRDLRGEILSLLDADTGGDSAKEDLLAGSIPDLAGLAARGSEETLGERLGPYRLLRHVGRGGMSDVYLAVRDDDAYEKRVAVKVILAGMNSPEGRERLRRERRILAALDHPHIARLLDGGSTQSGLPYLVMDYVEGQPIDVYCDDERLTVSQRLELFEKVLGAVRFAHQNLVVHRDLKPSNLLVEADGTPKLLDFGIAKLVNPELAAETSLATGPGLHLLTPSYSSPEQLRGEMITTASDVYSLGVMLYELLVGRRPHELAGRSGIEALRVVCESPPESASRAARAAGAEVAAGRRLTPDGLAKTLTGDLDAILAKALAREPRRRYPSAGELADDLERLRRHRPVAAHRDSLGYRIGKVVRRHRVASSLAAMLALAGVGVGVQSLRLAGAVDRVEAENQRSERVLDFLEGLFTEAQATQAPGGTEALAELLRQGAVLAERQYREQPAVQARLFDSIGTALRRRGLYDEARPLIEKSLSIRRRLFGAEHPEVARGLDSLGQLHASLFELPEAEASHREALAMRQRLLGAEHEEVAASYHHLAESLHTQGKLDEAGDFYRRALELRERLLGPEHRAVASTLGDLGFLRQEISATTPGRRASNGGRWPSSGGSSATRTWRWRRPSTISPGPCNSEPVSRRPRSSTGRRWRCANGSWARRIRTSRRSFPRSAGSATPDRIWKRLSACSSDRSRSGAGSGRTTIRASAHP